MSDRMTDYLAYLNACKDQDEVAVKTGQYIVEEGLLSHFQIIKHRIHPKPYKLLFSSPSQNLNMSWVDVFANCPRTEMRSDWIYHENNTYFFLTYKDGYAEGYLIYAEKTDIPKPVKQILHTWKQVYTLLMSWQYASKNQFNEEKGNLISQLVHDIQAIVLLSEGLKKSDDLAKRLAYQQSVNKNVTFYVRDTELIKISASAKDIIYTAIDLIGENRHLVKINSLPSDIQLTVDVELFSRALNEIVKNAIIHNKKQPPKIEISLNEEKSISPFIPFSWVKISVKDQGDGIPQDFLSLVKMPFFTTRKQQGSAGFGLTIAEKIINAHGGHVEIETKPGQGTQVTIYLPGNSYL